MNFEYQTKSASMALVNNTFIIDINKTRTPNYEIGS